MPSGRQRAAAQLLSLKIRQVADELWSRTYPVGDDNPEHHDGPTHWMNLVFGLLETAEARILEAFNRGISKKRADRAMTDALDYMNTAYEMCEHIIGSDTGSLHFPVVAPMQSWLRKLSIPSIALFRAQNVINYEIDWLDEYIEDLEAIPRKAESLKRALKAQLPIIVITVPKKAVSTIPQCAVVAHEVGHALYLRVGKYISRHLNRISGYRRKEQQILKQLSDPVKDPEGRVLSRARLIYDDWREEIAADAIAFMLTGPAALCALWEIFYLGNEDKLPSDTHPPAGIRLDLLGKAVSDKRSNFSDVIAAHGLNGQSGLTSYRLDGPDPSAAEIRNYYQDDPIDAEIFATLPQLIAEAGPHIYDAVRSYFTTNRASLVYTPAKLKKDLADHLGPLLQAIPPIESGRELNGRKPMDFVSILNIGAIGIGMKLDDVLIRVDPGHPFPEGKKAEKVDGLLVKAVELSEIRRRWEHHGNS